MATLKSTSVACSNDAEALAVRLKLQDALVSLLVSASGEPELSFWFGMLPPPPRACETAAIIRSRFAAEHQFRKDLFGHLDVEGRVYAPRPGRGFRINLDRPDLARIPRASL